MKRKRMCISNSGMIPHTTANSTAQKEAPSSSLSECESIGCSWTPRRLFLPFCAQIRRRLSRVLFVGAVVDFRIQSGVPLSPTSDGHPLAAIKYHKITMITMMFPFLHLPLLLLLHLFPCPLCTQEYPRSCYPLSSSRIVSDYTLRMLEVHSVVMKFADSTQNDIFPTGCSFRTGTHTRCCTLSNFPCLLRWQVRSRLRLGPAFKKIW